MYRYVLRRDAPHCASRNVACGAASLKLYEVLLIKKRTVDFILFIFFETVEGVKVGPE